MFVSYKPKVCARSSSSLLRKSGVRLADRPAMTIAVDYDVTRKNKQTKHIMFQETAHRFAKMTRFHPYMSNGFSHFYLLDEFITNFRPRVVVDVFQ